MPKNHTKDGSREPASKGASTLDLGTEWKVTGHKHNALHVKKNSPLLYRQTSTSVAARLENTFFLIKVHPCTGTEVLYRRYGPQGE